MQKNKSPLKESIEAAVEAGQEIMDVYHTDFMVEHKADDSPLTIADKRSHTIIMKRLQAFGLPILSEEGRSIPWSERKKWTDLWIVDPLDGTKEFIKKNDEFTVNIARVKNARPILGVIFVPAKKLLYFAEKDLGAYRCDLNDGFNFDNSDLTQIIKVSQRLPLQPRSSTPRDFKRHPYLIVGSRSHQTPELKQYVEDKRRDFESVDFIAAGSSMKFCLVAEGQADVYPRLGPTCEWDIAAGHIIAEEAGTRVFQHASGKPLDFNKADILNPWFIVSW